MKLPLDGIAAFLAVLDTGSLSGAARAQGLSQPTVRAQIADLERRLGAALFTRNRTGLQPTDRALELRGRAEAVGAAAEAFARAASGAADLGAGRVRLTASRVIAVHVLPAILAPLLAAHPGLTVELDATDAVQDLSRQDADVALRMTEPTQAGLVARRLRDVPLGIYAAPRLVSALGMPGSVADLLDRYPFVFEDRLRRMAQGFAAFGLPLPARVALATDDDLGQIAGIAAGIGAGLCQVGVAKAMGLVRLGPEAGFALPLWVAMHGDLRPITRVRTVFGYLAKALG